MDEQTRKLKEAAELGARMLQLEARFHRENFRPEKAEPIERAVEKIKSLISEATED